MRAFFFPQKDQAMHRISQLFAHPIKSIFLGCIVFLGLGNLYWLWLAIELGSFMMFVIGLLPLFAMITGPVGAWSLVFGLPLWVVDVFG